jgi:hypothetical protein
MKWRRVGRPRHRPMHDGRAIESESATQPKLYSGSRRLFVSFFSFFLGRQPVDPVHAIAG